VSLFSGASVSVHVSGEPLMTRLHRDRDSSPLAGSPEDATSKAPAGRSEWFPSLLVSRGVPGCLVTSTRLLSAARDPVSLFFGATVSVHVSGWPLVTRLHRDRDSSPLAGSSEVATSKKPAGRSEWFPLLLVSRGVPGCLVTLEGTCGALCAILRAFSSAQRLRFT